MSLAMRWRPIVGRCQGAIVGRRSDDRGSATVWVVCFGALVVATAMVAVIAGSAVLVRHRAERAADLGALAAASQIGWAAEPCQAARRAVAANGAQATSCVPTLDSSNRSGSVAVVVTEVVRFPVVGDRTVTARARAARLPPSGAPDDLGATRVVLACGDHAAVAQSSQFGEPLLYGRGGCE